MQHCPCWQNSKCYGFAGANFDSHQACNTRDATKHMVIDRVPFWYLWSRLIDGPLIEAY